MTAPVVPPPPVADARLRLGDADLDLRSRVVVAGVVPPPRFGREAEVQAAAAAVLGRGADVADVSLPPRLAGAVARAVGGPVATLAASPDQVAQARAAGARVVMVRPAVAARLAECGGLDAPGGATVVVVDDLVDLHDARSLARRAGVPLAFDSTGWSGPGAMAREAAAVAQGCRLLRTTDVRRSRRVAEVMAALLRARRPGASPAGRIGGDPS